jgi:putative ABC transport system permease protein
MVLQDFAYAARTLRRSPVFALTIAPGVGASTAIFSVTDAVAEVALSFVLFIGSGLMFRSFLALERVDPGFEAAHLRTFRLAGARAQTPDQRAAFERRVHQALASIPGVERVTASSPFPLAGGFSPIRWGTAEALADPSRFQAADFQIVLPGYFGTMRTSLVAGRLFTEADNAPNRDCVIVGQDLAHKLASAGSAVGKRILIHIQTPQPVSVEIVGVVGHQRDTSLADPGREQIYFPDAYLSSGFANTWALRVAGDPAGYARAVRAEIANINPHLLGTELRPMEALVEKAQVGTRFSLLLIGVFAAIAAVLAAVGLYGVLSTVVRQRTAEIGLRMAVGADPASIFELVVGHGLRLSAAGIAFGVAAALWLTRAMTATLVGVKATDPPKFAGIALLFFLIAALASWAPAYRAAGLDPTAHYGRNDQ